MLKLVKKTYRKMQRVKENIRKIYYREKKRSYGEENADKKFYVIRRQDSYIGCGLFSHVITTVASIRYAIENGYIPVVDMMNYPNLYITKKELHKVNAWEFYFEQPLDYDLKDISRSKYVTLSDGGISPRRPDVMKEDEFENWKLIFDKYVHLKKNIKDLMDSQWGGYVTSGERVLGVLCRGTDYTSLRPKNHPVQPDIEMVIEKIRSVISEQKYQRIFLATEDKEIYDRIICEFGEIVFINNKEFVKYIHGKGIGTFMIERENDNYKKGLEYLTSIYWLSKCDGIIAGQCGGTTGAMLFNNEYDYKFVWDLGFYS